MIFIIVHPLSTRPLGGGYFFYMNIEKNISIQEEDGYIRVLSSGYISSSNVVDIIETTLSISQFKESLCVLIEVQDSIFAMETNDLILLDKFLAHILPENLKVRIAFVVDSPNEMSMVLYFNQIKTGKLVEAAVFLNKEDALKWLKP